LARVTSGMVSSWVVTASRGRSAAGRPPVGSGSWERQDDSSETRISFAGAEAESLDLGVGSASRMSGRGGRLGRYELIERVGQGRQADVWRAVSTGPVVEEVALKVLPPSASARDPRRRAQLRHEAERGARLASPSLLPTYEFGEVEGAVFMAMPLVIGCSLAAIIEQRRAIRSGRRVAGAHRLAHEPEALYTVDAVALIALVARAAADAHEGRVVHRDIKPANILVRRNHAEGVFLCDFGLARDLDVATPSQLRDGAGSPLYMAPERLMKRTANEIGGDVYALGATLFEALTLAPLFEVPPQMPASMYAHFLASAEPRKPSAVWPSIPSALEAAIVQSTARDPSQRHPTADHFADDLDHFLAKDSAPARFPLA
jgi:eukaryotic-like serine/threonine-protein kinase